jgi:arsenate reductase-like glutaredoxin family protein
MKLKVYGIRRPIVEAGNALLPGFDAEEFSRTLKP